MPTSWLYAERLHHTTPYHIPYHSVTYHTMCVPYVHCMPLCSHTCKPYHMGPISTLTTIHTIHTISMVPYVYCLALCTQNIPHIHNTHAIPDGIHMSTSWFYYAHFLSLCIHVTPQYTRCHVISYHSIQHGINLSAVCLSCLHTTSTMGHGTHIPTSWVYAYIPYHTIHSIFAMPFGMHMPA